MEAEALVTSLVPGRFSQRPSIACTRPHHRGLAWSCPRMAWLGRARPPARAPSDKRRSGWAALRRPSMIRPVDQGAQTELAEGPSMTDEMTNLRVLVEKPPDAGLRRDDRCSSSAPVGREDRRRHAGASRAEEASLRRETSALLRPTLKNSRGCNRGVATNKKPAPRRCRSRSNFLSPTSRNQVSRIKSLGPRPQSQTREKGIQGLAAQYHPSDADGTDLKTRKTLSTVKPTYGPNADRAFWLPAFRRSPPRWRIPPACGRPRARRSTISAAGRDRSRFLHPDRGTAARPYRP